MKSDLFEILDIVPNILDRGQLVALCFAHGADVDLTLEMAEQINRDMDATDRD